MASYTMELRDIVDDLSQGSPFENTREKIDVARKKLFDFDYPIFNEDYKNVFETHFIRNFYMREIGAETEGLFKFNLETWLLINMPYFNKLYESELIQYDPLVNTQLSVTHNKKNDRLQNDTRDTEQNSTTAGTSKSDGTTTGTAESTTDKDTNATTVGDDFERRLESTNPDSRLALTANDGEGVIEYASQINENNQNNKTTATGSETATGTSTNTDTATNTATASSEANATAKEKANTVINDVEEFIESRMGKTGTSTYASMVNEYRSTLLRIEKQIFTEMQELFMLVY